VDEPDNPAEITGRELVEDGMPIVMRDKPSTAFVVYERL
jgi:hypothetical protein